MALQAQPAPVSWPPSQYWEPDDGWSSSFNLQVGSPGQIVRVLPSTAGQATWVVSNVGCPSDVPASCEQVRGGLFDSNSSSTWVELGFNSLGLESNLQPPDNATYGLDTVLLGLSSATDGPSLPNQILATLTGDEFVQGTFGLGQQPTNLTDFTEPHPSFLTTLHSQHMIPSLSWAYTAGAKYRLKEVYGSLTLGGFDTARFISNNVSFNLAPDISRDLVVGLQAITSRDANRSTYSLLASAHLTFIDSTVSEIYLPTDACRLFEQVYGLVWNTSYELYLVEEELHQNLLMRNPVFTFEISDSISNSGPDRPTVEINLPYSSFDLTYKVSYELPSVRYFPIRRAKNDSQMTLGRAFLQEAYVITDYSRGNFSVSQCRFEESMKPNLMPILPANTNLTVDPAPKPTMPQDKGSYLGRTKIAGITVGASLGFLLLFTLCCWPRIARCRRRWRRGSEIKANVSSREDIQRAFGTSYHLFHTPVKQSTPSFSLAKGFHGPKMLQEIDTSSWNGAREVPNNYKVELPENAKRFELSYSISPTPPEQLTRPTDAAQRLQPPTTPRRRHGSILTSGILSPGNIVRHWMRINDLRSSRGESPTSGRTSASAPSKPSFLEKPLPPTPDSESPQESVFPAWIRVAARHYDEQNSHPPPLRQLEEPYRHRRGFF